MAMPTGAPMEMARDTAMGMKMANTLQELPVEKEVRQAAMKMIAHIEVGGQEALAGADDPSGSAAGGADAADAPGQHEDHQDLHHARAALDEGAQGLLEVPDLGDHAHDDGGDGGQNEGGIQRPQELPLASAPKMPLVLMSPV